MTQAVFAHKSRLIALDVGVDFPNFPRLFNQIQSFCQLISEGRYQEAFYSWNTPHAVINGTSFARFVTRTFLRGIGKPVDLAWTLLMLCANGVPALLSEVHAFYKKYQSGSLEPRDLYSFYRVWGIK